jgi:hypothetical protein
MLFWLFGSSGAGKTSTVAALRDRIDRLHAFDFDDVGLAGPVDRAWRHAANERWLATAIDLERQGVDLLVAGQTPLGELLASPSAPLVEAISACLLDCDDATRAARLVARGAPWLQQSGGSLEEYIAWGAWMREHAADPNRRLGVIRDGADLDWQRLDDFKSGDARWHVHVISSTRPLDQVAAEVERWVQDERALLRSGQHRLATWTTRF